jgi:predicted PurR-regulated permease PerM
MYEKQTKGKIDLIGILAIVSLFLLPLIVKKIAELITWLNETYKIDDMIANVLKKVDWGKHISALFSFLWSAIKKLFTAIIEDPFNWLKA